MAQTSSRAVPEMHSRSEATGLTAADQLCPSQRRIVPWSPIAQASVASAPHTARRFSSVPDSKGDQAPELHRRIEPARPTSQASSAEKLQDAPSSPYAGTGLIQHQ